MSYSDYKIDIHSRDRYIVSIDRFRLFSNEITFLFGESGIGKSMLSKAVYGLLDPETLTVKINEQDYSQYLHSARTKEIQQNSFFVFQEPSSHLNPLMRINKQLNEGSLSAVPREQSILDQLWQNSRPEALQDILSVYPKPYRPSGGEKQRVLLAMAFKKLSRFLSAEINEQANLFVFDEPTGSLDDDYRNLFLQMLMQQYARQPFSALIITHDYSIISEIFKKHSNLLQNIHFNELSRKDDHQVVQSEFQPGEYLEWLKRTSDASKISLKQEREHDPLLRLNNSFKIFGRPLTVYRDAEHKKSVDFIIRPGELVYLKAPSGVGKTTLAKMIMGLYQADRFAMQLGGKTITEKTAPIFWQKNIWGSLAGMVFQHADEALNLQARVKEAFAGLPLSKKMTRELLIDTLQELFDQQIDDAFLNKKISLLSGGQKQRLNLLRTLILDARLIILDEPLNGLDFDSIKKVLGIIENKRRLGKAFLMISHNEEIFDSLVDAEHVFYLGVDSE